MIIDKPLQLPVATQPPAPTQVLKPPPIVKVGAILEALVSDQYNRRAYELTIGGHKVRAESERALQIGERFLIRVNGHDGQGKLLASTLTPAGREIASALHNSLPRQAEPTVLYQSLMRLALSGALPRQAVALLQALPLKRDLTRPDSLKQVIARSGLGLESSMAANQAPPRSDLKGMLLRLGALLARQPNFQAPFPAAPSGPAGDPSVEAIAPGFRPPAGIAGKAYQQLMGGLRQLPLSLGGAEGAAPPPENLKQLAKLVEQAVARIESQQLSSLQTRETQLPQWLFDLPVVNKGQIDVWHFCIKQELERRQSGKDKPESVWSVTLSVNLSGLGDIAARVRLQRGSARVDFYCDNGDLHGMIAGHLDELGERLQRCGLSDAVLAAHQGTLPDHFQPAIDYPALETHA